MVLVCTMEEREVFGITHMRTWSTDAQFFVFGYDHEWQPFRLAIRNAQQPTRSCTPDTLVYSPQLEMHELTVGSIVDMMTLLKAIKSEQTQKWDLQNGSVELYVLHYPKHETSFYLASAHHVCLQRVYGYFGRGNTIDVRIDKEFHTESTPRPYRWCWRQL